MSAQVVLPAKLPSRVGVTTSSKPTTSNVTSSTRQTPARFNRFRPPRKPDIQVDKNKLKQKLTPLQYKVTQEKFTERPFSGEYVRLNDKGIYCCIVCGEELFSSETKYDSGCGWPAFFNSLDSEKLILQTDLSHVGGNLLLLALNQDLARTEVTCAKCGSHLGHVFDDGPKPTGKRYCVNSASLKFKKTNGEEVVYDIPVNERETKTCSKPITNNEKSQQVNKKPIASVSRLETQINESKQVDKKLFAPNSRVDIQKNYLSSKRTQMNREDFFKSINTRTSDFDRKTNNVINQNIPTKPVLNRIKKISNAFDDEDVSGFKSDVNNNKTVQNKYIDVKSRYLDHLDSLAKKSVMKHTYGPSKKLSNPPNSILESDL